MVLNQWIATATSLEVRSEAKELWSLAWPLILFSLWNYIGPTVALIFCGPLGTNILDGVALSGSLINITAISVANGMCSACDTLFAQAYGAGNRHCMSGLLQRSLIIITLSSLPCIAFQLNAEALLVLIGQDREVSHIAAEYLAIYSPATIANFVFLVFAKYLQSQDILYPTIVFGLVGNILNAVLHAIFISWLEWGHRASAISLVVYNVAMAVAIIIYCIYSPKCQSMWQGWNIEALLGWKEFMHLALPGLAMICIEWWSLEIGVFVSGLLSVTQQSVQSVLFQFEAIVDIIGLGIGFAAAIRVGQHLGGGDFVSARRAAALCIVAIITIDAIIAVIITILRNYIPKIFTEDDAVITLAATLLPVLALYELCDGTSAVCSGIVRGCGRQLMGSLVVVFGYYVLALPIGLSLMLVTETIDPLWWAFFGSMALACTLYIILIFRLDWEQEAKDAQERVGISEKKKIRSRVSRHGSFAVSVSIKIRGDDTDTSALLGSTLLTDAATSAFYESTTETIRETELNPYGTTKKLALVRTLQTAAVVSTVVIGAIIRICMPPYSF